VNIAVVVATASASISAVLQMVTAAAITVVSSEEVDDGPGSFPAAVVITPSSQETANSDGDSGTSFAVTVTPHGTVARAAGTGGKKGVRAPTERGVCAIFGRASEAG